MKRFIIILPPVILFAIFVFFYKAHVKELEEKQAAAKVLADKAKADEEARKKVLQEAADKEAQRQKEARLAEIEKQKEEERNKKEERDREIIAQTEAANASSKKLQAQIIKLPSRHPGRPRRSRQGPGRGDGDQARPRKGPYCQA
jgi:uncharacterized membrane protein YqiK